ncbi:MAG: hypothetical protein ABW110_04760 [Steroidobacteraceae bacterium]
MSVYVVGAFVQLRHLLASNKELAQKLAELERKISTHDQAIGGILKAIRELMSVPRRPRSDPSDLSNCGKKITTERAV